MFNDQCSMFKYRWYRGIILPVVLVIFALLAMLVIGFGFATRAEYAGLSTQMNIIQARQCALSGIESAAVLLRENFNNSRMWMNNPDIFRDRIVFTEGADSEISWRFSLLGVNFDSQDVPRFGVTDEAGKVNINVASEDQLRRLPKMTSEIASYLVDWRSGSSKEGENASKDSYYMSLAQPYRCKKAPLDTVEELLLVRGFDSSILFGEDMNRNGILDPNEDDGRKSLPIDNGDGVLDRGLYPYITVWSREPEVTDSDPYQPRIDIKNWPTVMIKSMMEKNFDKSLIDFIVTAREAKVDFAESPASLIGMSFKYNGQQYSSPAKVEDLPMIMDMLTTGYHLHSDGYVYGRININTASKTVLQTIGRLTEKEIDGILSMRSRLESETLRTTAWLVTQNIVDIEKFKKVATLLTARSYQFMIDAIGYRDGLPIQERMQVVLELRLPKVQYIYCRNLSSLGRSYNVEKFGETIVVTK